MTRTRTINGVEQTVTVLKPHRARGIKEFTCEHFGDPLPRQMTRDHDPRFTVRDGQKRDAWDR